MDKTVKDAEIRLNTLNGMRPNLSNALAAESDAIQFNGVKGWNEYLKKAEARRADRAFERGKR